MAKAKTSTAEEVKETEAAAEVVNEQEKLMYVGPTIPGIESRTSYTQRFRRQQQKPAR